MNNIDQFTELLKELLQGQNIAQLAKNAGIDRSAIYKALRSETLSEKAANGLADALQFTPARRKEFLEAWGRTRPQYGISEQRRMVEQFISRVDELSSLYSANGVIRSSACQDLSPFSGPVQPIYGQLNIRKILGVFIEHEAAKKAGHIWLKLQPDNRFMESLFPIMDNHAALTIDHILCFAPIEEAKNLSTRNFGYLNNILPFLIADCQYNPRVYYDYIAEDQGAFLPYLVLTGDCAMCISDDFESAVLYRSHEMLQFFEKQFSRFTANSAPLGRRFSPAEHLEIFSQYAHAIAPSEAFFFMTYEPCMAAFYDEELLNACISPQIPNKSQLVSAFLNYSAMLLQKSPHSAGYFSLKGLHNFLETGTLSEIPPQFYTPVPPALRTRLIRAFCEAAKQNLVHPFMLKEQIVCLPACLSISVYASAALISINLPDKKYLSILLEEKSIVRTFQNYFHKLSTSEAVCSEEETLRMMQEMLGRYV